MLDDYFLTIVSVEWSMRLVQMEKVTKYVGTHTFSLCLQITEGVQIGLSEDITMTAGYQVLNA